MSCFNCRYYTGLQILPCGVDPITAASSPEEGCREWQPYDDGDDYTPTNLEVRGRPWEWADTPLFNIISYCAFVVIAITVAYTTVIAITWGAELISPPVIHYRED